MAKVLEVNEDGSKSIQISMYEQLLIAKILREALPDLSHYSDPTDVGVVQHVLAALGRTSYYDVVTKWPNLSPEDEAAVARLLNRGSGSKSEPEQD